MKSTRELGVLNLFKDVGAIITGSHVVYTSGKHGSAYVNKDGVYPNAEAVSILCRELAAISSGQRPQVVCGPAMGGIILSQWTGYHLKIPAVYAEKLPEGGMSLQRGYDKLVKGKRVLVVEDILTTGGSVRETVRVVRNAGGNIVAVAALINRGDVKASDVGVPHLHWLASIALEAWDESECPLCEDGVPINTTVGKGREFLAKRHSA